jgi:hypothetical protein
VGVQTCTSTWDPTHKSQATLEDRRKDILPSMIQTFFFHITELFGNTENEYKGQINKKKKHLGMNERYM